MQWPERANHGQPGDQKRRHANGVYCGRAEKVPRLTGLRGWHQVSEWVGSPKTASSQKAGEEV